MYKTVAYQALVAKKNVCKSMNNHLFTTLIKWTIIATKKSLTKNNKLKEFNATLLVDCSA